MIDITVRLLNWDEHCEDDCIEAVAEIEKLRAEVSKWKKMDVEASEVEAQICMRSNYFTGEDEYVGWKGLALALKQDYDELIKLREKNKILTRTIEDVKLLVEYEMSKYK